MGFHSDAMFSLTTCEPISNIKLQNILKNSVPASVASPKALKEL